MRFQCQLKETSALEESVSTLCRLTVGYGQWILVMAKDSWNVATDHSTGTIGPRAFMQIDAECAFDRYRIESSEENNRICIGIDGSFLSRALKTCTNARKVVLALTKRSVDGNNNKKHSAFLSFRIFQDGEVANLVQDVPITVFSSSRIEDTLLPHLTEPLVKFPFPLCKSLKLSIDRMRHLCDIVNIVAFRNQELVFRTKTSDVSIKTVFRSVEMEGSSHDDGVDEFFGSCWVDGKHLSKAMICSQVQSGFGAIGCMIEDEGFLVHAQIGEGISIVDYLIPLRME